MNATPLGMQPGDSLPVDVTRLAASTFVAARVVMKTEITPLLQAARERGCRIQIGTDMLFEMTPAYLEFFGFGSATSESCARSQGRIEPKIAYPCSGEFAVSEAKPILLHGRPVSEGAFPLICVPLVGRSRDAVLAEVDVVLPKKPDVLEWRVDFFEALGDTTHVIDTARAIRDRVGPIPRDVHTALVDRGRREDRIGRTAGRPVVRRNLRQPPRRPDRLRDRQCRQRTLPVCVRFRARTTSR